MHALSLGTWWIHITSVLEWLLAIFAVQAYGRQRHEPAMALTKAGSMASANHRQAGSWR